MSWVVGILVQIVTFPGIVVQTVSRKFFCDLFKVAVYDVDYVRGTILYEKIENIHKAFLVAVAPLFINTILCMILTFPVSFSFVNGSDAADNFTGLLPFYLGLCAGMHAIPSKKSIDNFTDQVNPRDAVVFFRWIYRSIAVLFGIFGFLKQLWFDAIYAICASLALPLGVNYVIVG